MLYRGIKVEGGDFRGVSGCGKVGWYKVSIEVPVVVVVVW